MDKHISKFIIVSLISAILAFSIIIEAMYITPSLAQTTGRYIEVSRIINIPKSNTSNTSNLSSNSS